ncbi:hypothetical protein EDD11_010059 [Mortierella claussenii]|nr:hypothetical protein EDD11_010059 [Mortierella claussenii]
MPIYNNINGSMDALLLSPCTNGSPGFDSQFFSVESLKATVEIHPSISFGEQSAAQEDKQYVKEDTQDSMTKEEVEDDVEVFKVNATKNIMGPKLGEVKKEEVEVKKDVEFLVKPSTMLTVTETATPVKTGMPTTAQARSLSAASLELKKKQAAEEAAAALKSLTIVVPKTDSIANRVKMFGGAASPGHTGWLRRSGVRDIVRKYTNVEKKSQDTIAHVHRGHSDSEPRGVCSAYSLSTASRPLRPTSRCNMSHEQAENEARQVVKGALGGMARSDGGRAGVSQESVCSVRNAKSMFETLARDQAVVDGGR